VYGITRSGNFERGRTIPPVSATIETLATKFRMTQRELELYLEVSRKKLYAKRLQRERPATDDKILTSWNGLAISALSYGYQVLGEERYLRAAEGCARFMLGTMLKDGRLLRRYRYGVAGIEGSLEDYAYLVYGLLDLYESDFDAEFLAKAIELSESMLRLFWDDSKGGFFMQQRRNELPVSIKEGYDGPTPSGNSVAALILLRISEFTGDERFRRFAEQTVEIFHQDLDTEPSSHTFMLMALDFLLGGAKEVILAPGPDNKGAQEMVREIHGRFIPNKVLMVVPSGADQLEKLAPVARGKKPVGGRATAYICENFTCKLPITALSALKSALSF